jgi:hypothetical protein
VLPDPVPAPPAELVSQQTQMSITAPGADGEAQPTVGAPVSATLDDVVKRFKAKADVTDNTNPMGYHSSNISGRGQFFWSEQVAYRVREEIIAVAAEPGGEPFAAKALAAWREIFDGGDAAVLLGQLRALAQKSASPARPRMDKLLQGFASGGHQLEAQLWAQLRKRKDDTLPDLTGLRSLITLRTLRSWDFVGCVAQALNAGQRVQAKGGLNTPAPGTKLSVFSRSLSTGQGIRDRRSVFDASMQYGDILAQSDAGGAAKAVRDALDAGGLVHARVLSGIGVGGNSLPDPNAKPHPIQIPATGEHTILIIGHDGTSFVFHDPDAAVSHSPEPGFGVLHYDAGDNRLSTAKDHADMAVDTSGKHVRGDKRYQLLAVTVIPR